MDNKEGLICNNEQFKLSYFYRRYTTCIAKKIYKL